MRHLPIIAIALVSSLHGQEPFTYETDDALFSSGDFNGDGHTDLVIVDKNDGSFSVGFAHAADDGFDWSARHPSGFASPTGLAVGVFDGSFGVFAITAPDENRVTGFAFPDASTVSASSQHLFPTGPAPRTIAGFFVNADTSTDYAVAGFGGNYYIDTVTFGEPAAVLTTSAQIEETRRLWRVVPEPGAIAHAVSVRGTSVWLATVDGTGVASGLARPGYVAGENTRTAYGNYSGAITVDIMLYETGGTGAKRSTLSEFLGFYGWGLNVDHTFPKPLALLTTVGTRLGALFTDGTAATYDITAGVLTHRSDLPGTHELLAPIGGDAFLSIEGTNWQRWDASSAASTLTPVSSGAFPSPGTPGNVAAVSNIVFTDKEPLVDPTAKALFFGRARDWTTAATGMDRNWTVTSLSQTPAGLASATSLPFDTDDPDTDDALVNQVASNASIRLLVPNGYGKPTGDLLINPLGGTYSPLESPETQTIRLSTDLAGATIFYHFQPLSTWIPYDPSNPPEIPAGIASTTIEAYAQNATSRTPTRRATYTFAASPALTTGSLIDADGDGLPDQWEDAFNAYDPFGDADGDGVNNLTEFENCTDPHDAGSIFPVDLVLEATFVGSDTLRLEWSLGLPEAILQSSLDLNEWEAITSGIGTVPGRYRLDVPRDIRRFYRLVR